MKNEPQDRSTLTIAILLGAIIVALTFLGARVLGAQGAPERGAFLIRTATDTLVIERFTRSADSLVGSINVKGQGRTDYVAVLGPGHAVRTLSLNLFRAVATEDEAPLRRVFVTMRDDTAVVDVDGTVQRIATKADAITGVNNAFALFELFLLRARDAGGTAEIPYFALSGGVTVPVNVKPNGPDSLIATVAGQENRLKVDASGRVLGGTIPAGQLEVLRLSAEAAAGLKIGRPSYAAPADAPYAAEDVEIRGPGGIPLGGTLTLPRSASGPVPAIVTITGSGQQDRDEFIPVGGGYRPFRQIADTLGRRGIAVLRLDDRMIGVSGGKLGTSADYAEDIRAALAYLRTRKEIDAQRLGVLGHSEGGLIGPMVAVAEPALKAVVILAGPAYNGLEIVRYQNRYAIDRDSMVAPAKRDSAYQAAYRKVDSAATMSDWYKFFLTYDPLATARKVRAPTLVLQGATDSQITPEQAEKLAAAMRAGGNRDVTVRVFPELNHLFIHDPDGSFAHYGRIKTGKMSAEVLGAIADWLAVKLSASTSK